MTFDPQTRGRAALLSRRRLLTLGLASAALAIGGGLVPGFGAISHAQASTEVAQQIANHFAQTRTMMGEFVQFGPRGEQTGGKFFIERPGKLRFVYESPSDFQVTADGNSVVMENRRLQTADLYALSTTPLKLILDERIDLSGNKVRSVSQENDLTTIQLADRSLFGNSTITMMFDPQNYDLRQWTITDAQGRDTTVMIFNVQTGVTFDPSVFNIDYRRVQAMGGSQQQ